MLKEEILNALREKGEMTSTELMEYLRDKGSSSRPWSSGKYSPIW